MIIKILNKIKQRRVVKSIGKVGLNTQVKPGVFGGGGNIEVGDNCYIGPGAFWDGNGKISIGDNVIFGPRTVIWTVNHNYESEKYLPYDNVDYLSPVVIGDNCWIGFGAHIVPGVRVGEGAVVAMGAVVVADVPPLAVVGGNPAKVLKYRDSHQYNKVKNLDRSSYIEAKARGEVEKEYEWLERS